MKKHLFFDMDGTVCESKQVIGLSMLKRLRYLNVNYDIIIISGQSIEHMNRQLDGFECTRMPQSGNIMPMWCYSLSAEEKAEINKHISTIRSKFRKYFSWKRNDYIDDRGCQISLSFMGHGATFYDKINFDPVHAKRKDALTHCPFISKTLDCTIAGTTCLDYTRKDGKKGNNIARFIEHIKWDKDECVYFGDALFKGGNDESVIGVIDTVEVSGPEELLIKLEQYD